MLLTALLLACSSSPPPEPSDAREPSPELQEHMQGHLTAVRTVRDALRRGDLAAAKQANKAFLDHEVAFDLPGDWVHHITAMGAAAMKLEEASDLAAAAEHAAEVVQACVACHDAVEVEVELPVGVVDTPTEPEPERGKAKGKPTMRRSKG